MENLFLGKCPGPEIETYAPNHPTAMSLDFIHKDSIKEWSNTSFFILFLLLLKKLDYL
uniref:Uncharacterized protein n=1 Tax=Anguilla anguilla TaxID=7936 RepID=A0A0E9Q9P8_ANGAN